MKLNLIFLLILLFAYESLEKKKGKNGKKKPSCSSGKKPKPPSQKPQRPPIRPPPRPKPPRTTKGPSSVTSGRPVISTTKIPSPKDCEKMNKTFTENMPTYYPVCPGLPKPLRSTETLGPGCLCETPYSLNATGFCILRTDCPIRSIPTSTSPPKNPCEKPWLNVQCRSACPQTCDEKLQADCLIYCLPSGCSCVAPYFLSANGSCVLKRDCPKEKVKLRRERPIKKTCTGNWTHGSGRDSCERTCGSTVDYSRCMKQTIGETCLCRFPFAINNRGLCVHVMDC